MSFFKALVTCIKNYEIVETFIQHEKIERERREEELKKDNLKLCLRHQQERNHSHFSEDNCDYCKLQRRIKILNGELHANGT